MHTDTLPTRTADANTIWKQIGIMNLMAVGARNVVDLGDGIRFTVLRGRHVIVVKLTPMDLYAVEFATKAGRSIEFVDGLYGDQLADVIYRMTHR